MTRFGVRPWLGNPRFAPPKRPIPISRSSDEWPPEVMAALAAAEQRGYDRGIADAKKAADDAKKAIVASMVANNFPVEPSPMLKIAMQVAAEHGFSSWREMREGKHSPKLIWARWQFWDRVDRETGLSRTAMGRFLGFDHSTVVKGLISFRKKSSANAGLSVNCGQETPDVED